MASSTAHFLLALIVILYTARTGKADFSTVEVTEAEGNGILSCRPGVKFPRDCGNICQCAADGSKASCSSNPCPVDTAEFDKAIRQAYKEWSVIDSEGSDPVFRCKPYTVRKVNDVNGRCFCAKSGISEICSTRKGTPWGGEINLFPKDVRSKH